MKPIRITMQGFGSYTYPCTLDFTALGERPLFLITGSTGGGKTTILDAMCFALYCQATGKKRGWASMRSNNMVEESPTIVDFTFQLGDTIYRFCRKQTVHHITKGEKKGEQIIRNENACYSLPKDAASTTIPLTDWTLLCTTDGLGEKVTKYAEQLLGLTCVQFSQVMVLPQGDFLKLLLASSSQKTEIFKTLFDTKLWEKITKQAKEQAQKLQKESDELLGTRNMIFTQEAVESAEELTEKYNQFTKIIKEEQGKSQLLEQTIAKQTEQLKCEQQIADKIEEQQALQKTLQALIAQKPEINQVKEQLDFAKKAEQLVPYYTAHTKALAVYTQKTQEKTNAENQLKHATEAYNQSKCLAENLVPQRKKILIAEKEADSLANALQLCQRYEELLKTQEALLSASKDSTEKQQTTQNKLTKINERIVTGEAYAKKLTDMQIRLPTLQNETNTLLEQKKQLDLLEKEKNESTALQQNYELLEKQANDKKIQLLAQKKQLESEEAFLQADLAVNLAATLEPQTPCPVCGSLQHPAPATQVTHEHHFTPEDLKALRTLVQKDDEAYQTLLSTLNECKGKYMQKMQVYKEQVTLCSNITASSQDLDALLTAKLNEITATKTELEKQERATEKLTNLQEELKQENDDFLKAQTALQLLQTKLATNTATVKEVSASLGNYKTTAAVNVAHKACIEKIDSLKKELLEWEGQIENANRNVTLAETENKNAIKALQEATAEKQTAHQIFQEKLCQFAIPATKAALNFEEIKTDESTLKTWAASIQSYEFNTTTTENQLQALTEFLKGKASPNIIETNAFLAQTTSEHSHLIESIGVLKEKQNITKNAIEQLGASTKKSEQIMKSYEELKKISELLSGSNPKKVPIQQFVLGMKLDDILSYANQKFTQFSRGRYNLQRKLESSGGGYQGLDLEVLDGNTGTTRSIDTLSGGEQFLASLSLAFGLSDVVQSYSGNVRLDSIFIDEGFGSLDQDTLDTAIKTLIEIQQSGRTIGIISHVTELKSLIPKRIEVSLNAKGGSTAVITNDE